MPWRFHTEVGGDRTVHVWPEADGLDHVTEGGDFCWCEPVITEEGHGVVVTHKDELDRWHDAELSRPIPSLGSKD